MSSDEPLLRVRDLVVERGGARIVDQVSFAIAAGQLHGLVGESGSGKSTLAKALLGVLPHGMRASGEVLFEGVPLLGLPAKELRALRGRALALVPQEPHTALNPVLTLGDQLSETVATLEELKRAELRERCVSLLRDVCLPNPEECLKAYPHQLSGGMLQRALIALALAGRPKLLLADEPTTALDAPLRAEIVALLMHLAQVNHLAVLLLSHDLDVVAHACHFVSVLYGGTVVEQGLALLVLQAPRHPYTRALLAARPAPNRRWSAIAGMPPSPSERFDGCRFHPRCSRVDAVCRRQSPRLQGENWRVACHFAGEPAP